MEKEAALILLKINAVSLRPKEPFTFASGIKSPIYCDNRILMSYPNERNIIVNYFLDVLKSKEFDVLAGTSTAGIPWCAWLAKELGKPMIYVRGKAKEHGKENLIEGKLDSGKKVIVVEDLISTGGSSVGVVEAVRSSGGIVEECVAIFSYQFEKAKKCFEEAKCRLTTLTNFEVLVNVAAEGNYIKLEDKELVLEWNKDPGKWGERFGNSISKVDGSILLLKNGRIFLDGELQGKDILIENGKIKEIGIGLNAERIEDCSGKIILPGAIDVHVHFREPGATHKEDFLSGSKAAAAGGVTTILDMPNNNPSVVSQQDIDNKKQLAGKSIVNYGFYVGASPTNIEIINEIKDAVAVKVYLGSSTGNLLLDKISDFVRLMEKTDKLVVVHAENEELIKYFSEKYGKTKMHHMMRDNLAAAVSVSESVTTANYLRKRIHIAHMSTKEEVELLRKHKNSNVSCEVCPHHLFLDKEFFMNKGNFGKMNPPLRYDEDKKALWQAIRDGIVDIISTDHAPHTLSEKNLEFEKSPCGVPGVQTMLPLILNEVNNGNLKIRDVIRLCCENPAKIFKLKDRGMIKKGYYADFTIVDMNKRDLILNEKQFSKCGWTPFHGREIVGWPVMTIVNGEIVYKDGKIFEDKKGKLVEIGEQND